MSPTSYRAGVSPLIALTHLNSVKGTPQLGRDLEYSELGVLALDLRESTLNSPNSPAGVQVAEVVSRRARPNDGHAGATGGDETRRGEGDECWAGEARPHELFGAQMRTADHGGEG